MKILLLPICLVMMWSVHASQFGFLDPEIQEVFKYRMSRSIGGIYEGRVRPIYVDNRLFFQPIEAIVHNRPSCAARTLLQLRDERTSLEFRNKFDMMLASWNAGRELVLVGTGTCSPQGDEIIFAVIPK